MTLYHGGTNVDFFETDKYHESVYWLLNKSIISQYIDC